MGKPVTKGPTAPTGVSRLFPPKPKAKPKAKAKAKK